MRIALITPGFSIDSDDWAIPALQSFAAGLARMHEIYVFSLRYPAPGFYGELGVKHQAIGGGRSRGLGSFKVWWKTYQAITQQHRKTPFDVLHAFWADEPGFVGAFAAKRLGLPLLVSLGGGELLFLKEIGYGTQGSLVRRWIIKIGLNNADLVSTGSEYQNRLVQRFGVPTERLRNLPLGVDTARFQPGSIPDWNKPTIVQAASLTPVKNQTMLLDVFKLAHDRVPELRLVVAGGGHLEIGLKQKAIDLGLSNYVKWYGSVPFPEMAGVYGKAHLYLQSSRHESQGMSVLESLASGLPAIGTPVGVLPEVSCRPVSFDRGELAEQVIAVFGDRSDYSKLKRLARDTIEGRFDLDTCNAGFIDSYRSLVGDG
jgi:glycosyltransferase involved in cell wall biosynthesis